MNGWLKTTIAAGLSILSVAALLRAAEIDTLSSQDASNTARFPENQAPSTLNNGARALEGMIARWYYDTNCSQPTAGSSNSYTYTATRTIASYATGQVFCLRASFQNTGTASLNVSGLGGKQIFKYHDQGLASGDIESGHAMLLVYDGVAFQLMSETAGGNLQASNNLSDVSSVSTARTNLGLGTAAVHNTGTTNQTIPVIGSNSTLTTGVIPAMGAASAIGGGAAGMVTPSNAGDQNSFLRGDATWKPITPRLIGTTISATTGAASTTITIPNDDTVPLITEGQQFLAVSHTANAVGNTLKFKIVIHSGISSGWGACALYRDRKSAAYAWGKPHDTTSVLSSLYIEFITTINTTNALGWSVRCGTTSAGTFSFNGLTGSTRLFGGALESYLRVEEYAN